MRPPRTKRVYPEDIKPGDEFEGYVSGFSHHMCTVNVQEDGTPLTFNQYPIKEKVDYFEKELTYQEQAEWYKSAVDMTDSANQLNLSRSCGRIQRYWNTLLVSRFSKVD